MSEENRETPTTGGGEGGNTPQAPAGADVSGDGQQPGGDGQQTFTQADLDRIIPQRAQQAARQMLAQALGDRGFQSLEELDTSLNQLTTFKQERQTEKERLEEAARLAKERAERAEAQVKDLEQVTQQTLIKAALSTEAAQAGAAHPDDAYLLAGSDLGSVTVGDNGAVAGARELVQKLVDSGRLALSGRPAAPPLNGGAGSGERTGETIPPLTEDELEVARSLRISPEEYAANKTS